MRITTPPHTTAHPTTPHRTGLHYAAPSPTTCLPVALAIQALVSPVPELIPPNQRRFLRSVGWQFRLQQVILNEGRTLTAPPPEEVRGGPPAAYDKYVACMSQCQSHDPTARPTYQQIIGLINELREVERKARRRSSRLTTPPNQIRKPLDRRNSKAGT